MNTSKYLPLAALVTMLVGAGAIVATAQSVSDAATAGDAQVVQAFGPGDGHGRRGGGPMGGMMRDMMGQVDADADGAVTQAEIDAWRTAQLAAADTSGDGQVSLAEFGPALTALMQPRIVDAFQQLDADGDGQITAAELEDISAGMVARMDHNGDGALSPADRSERGGRGDRGGHRHGG